MSQDFDHRISIVINRELPIWQAMNTVAHISGYFGNVLAERFRTGDHFVAQDGSIFPRNSQFPIVALAAEAHQLPFFAEKVRATSDVQSMFFIREMIETTDDEEIVRVLATKNAQDIELLGVGLFGENQKLKELTKPFKLWSS